jgi:lysyl-tRNA synthetase class 2
VPINNLSDLATASFRYEANLEYLEKRARILQKIRAFFVARNLLEVETPLLAYAPVTDPHIDALAVFGPLSGEPSAEPKQYGYLQTSPEYAMKRLLAMGVGSCFQICKAFRADPPSKIHHHEFTMLEWYRLGFTDRELMQETDDLLQTILNCPPSIRLSYENAFLHYLKISALNSSVESLKKLFIEKFGPIPHSEHFTLDDWRMLLFSHGIEPFLTGEAPYIIFDFPASQAALAKIKNTQTAARFEVYVQGIELANGYHELQDPDQQRRRFDSDLALRASLQKKQVPIDQELLLALEHGLPDCAGIALGIDRLIFLALKAKNIREIAVIA